MLDRWVSERPAEMQPVMDTAAALSARGPDTGHAGKLAPAPCSTMIRKHAGAEMSDQDERPETLAARPNTLLLGICGWVGILGAVAVLISNLVGSAVVPDYNWVADTISDLAAGRYEIIQDVGLYAFAGSLLACSVGASHAHDGSDRWSLSVIALSLMAALVVVIAARNEYGDSDPQATWGVHLGLVYLLMLLFLFATVLMAPGLGRVRPRYLVGSLLCTGLFVVSAGAYFVAPNGYDGLVERAVALVSIAWVAIVSSMLLERRSGPFRRPRG